MHQDERTPRKGRQPKDAALVLRDRYWTLHLKSQMPDESYASLERKLMAHLRIGRRENGEGYSQPFSLSKIARGTRGLSSRLDEVHPIVLRADHLLPGSLAVYTSILWRALVSGPASDRQLGSSQAVTREVLSRIFDRHFENREALKLNLLGVRRLSRISHIDAVGLLLRQCEPAIEATTTSLTAQAYVLHLIHQLSVRDCALQAIQKELVELVKERYLGLRAKDDQDSAKIFLGPRVSSTSTSLRRYVADSIQVGRFSQGSIFEKGSPEAEALLQELAHMVEDTFEPGDATDTWLTSPHPLFAEQTPLQVAQTEEGARTVKAVLIAIKYGGVV